jgi:two-component sensor histidine kinase
MPDFGETFEARLLALARAHDLLTDRNWMSAPLEKLLEDIVAPYAGGGERLRLEGPHVDLNPRAALSMTMVLNELATNAAKYGSLSKNSGTLSVDWRLSDGADATLELNWLERGGPRVMAPARQGFGTRLIERCVNRDLEGQLDLQFTEKGAECRIDVPLGVLAADA